VVRVVEGEDARREADHVVGGGGMNVLKMNASAPLGAIDVDCSSNYHCNPSTVV